LSGITQFDYEPAAQIKGSDPAAPPIAAHRSSVLAKDKEERYQTIKDVAIELKELRRELKRRRL